LTHLNSDGVVAIQKSHEARHVVIIDCAPHACSRPGSIEVASARRQQKQRDGSLERALGTATTLRASERVARCALGMTPDLELSGIQLDVATRLT